MKCNCSFWRGYATDNTKPLTKRPTIVQYFRGWRWRDSACRESCEKGVETQTLHISHLENTKQKPLCCVCAAIKYYYRAHRLLFVCTTHTHTYGERHIVQCPLFSQRYIYIYARANHNRQVAEVTIAEAKSPCVIHIIYRAQCGHHHHHYRRLAYGARVNVTGTMCALRVREQYQRKKDMCKNAIYVHSLNTYMFCHFQFYHRSPRVCRVLLS